METGNKWRKRETISFPCVSGNKIIVRRPGPDLALKAGKVARILKAQSEAGTDVNKQLEFIETLPDDELEKLMTFARIFVSDVVINPPLSLHPKEGQLSPDDVPLEDFWQIFISGMRGFPEAAIKTVEGETSIEAVQTFSGEQDASVDISEDSESVQ